MMFGKQSWPVRFLAVTAVAGLMASCGGKKYENPITKDTQQPDKVLFDKAIKDLERNRFEVARLTLQTLMNTYDTSEYLAKAKLAYADSWYREGGSHGLAQAEAEYKDFILFYPTLEESAEAQEKVCEIHFHQMEKADRDPQHALRAEEECKNLLVQFPNSKFAPQAQQRLREVQEVLAEGEYRRGVFYHTKGSNAAAANRLQNLTDTYPLYSQSDQANWFLAEAYSKMGPRFRSKAGDAYARIVREYPLSALVDESKKKLRTMELPIPEPDPVAYARMKYELENREKPGFFSKGFGVFSKSPDVRTAAKSGTPAMNGLRPSVPVNVPAPGQGAPGFSGEVSASQVSDSTALDTQPDARQNPPAAGATGAAPAATPGAPAAGSGTEQPAGSGSGEQAAAPADGTAANGTAKAPDPQPVTRGKVGKPKKQKKTK